MSSKAELRRKVAQEVARELTERPIQTHSVLMGKFRYPAYQDGDVIRSLTSGEVLARRTKKGWDRTVKTVSLVGGRYDNIRPATEPVQVTLDKGRYY